jgi:hypothetical protein
METTATLTSIYSREKSVTSQPLINPEKVFLSPLYIKLGLIKNSVEAVDQNGSGFIYLQQKFTRSSKDIIEQGIFVGLQTSEIMRQYEHGCLLGCSDM